MIRATGKPTWCLDQAAIDRVLQISRSLVTQREIAREAGHSRSTVAEILSGRAQTKLDKRLASAVAKSKPPVFVVPKPVPVSATEKPFQGNYLVSLVVPTQGLGFRHERAIPK